MKYFIKTFGCRTNFAESDELQEKLSKIAKPAKSANQATIIIIRACSVTSKAEQRVRQEIRKHKRGGKRVYVLGCFMEKIPQANGYFRNDSQLIDHLSLFYPCGRKDKRAIAQNKKSQENGKKVRAFIKIQQGCDFDCSFCITKILRGKSKPISKTKILRQIKEKESQGYKEIVLTGTNILLYPNIHNLVKSILQLSTIPRIRFGSIDPRLVNDNFLNLFKNPRLMPHIHLSIQSGSERILRDMKRFVKISKIINIATKLRIINPLFNISADIIVGYPTETKNDFEKTCKLAQKLKLCKLHYFPYSTRPKTSAEKLKPLESQTIKERLAKIKTIDKRLSRQAKSKIKNKKMEVLFEKCDKKFCYGYTSNFIRIKHSCKKNLTNKIKEIIIIL